MIILALVKGIRRTVSFRSILTLLLLCNLALSVSLALTFHHTLSSAFGDSRASLALLAGFDSTVVTDLRRMHPAALPGFLQIVGVASLFYVFLNTFLAGGVISALRSSVRPSLREFLVSCTRFFKRFFRLFLLTGSIALILATLFLALGGLLMSALYRVATSETVLFLGAGSVGAVILGTILLLVMIADYAKIGIVSRNSHAITGALIMSLRFILRNPGSTLGLQTLFLLITFFLATVHALFWTSQQSDSTPILIAVFLLHQLFIFVRIAVRVFAFGAESALFEALQPAKGDEIRPEPPDPGRTPFT
ncbi:MAG: hypothetical protein WBG01_00540 [Bacteroidota bacterium]